MADTDTTTTQQASDDVKRSFAWGQLFVGSILAGFSVYQLGLKALSMPPSEMLAGIVATYEAVRDFLVTPLLWLQLDLTGWDRDALVISAVLLSALVRAGTKSYVVVTLGIGVSAGWLFLSQLNDPRWQVDEIWGMQTWVYAVFRFATVASIFVPVLSVMPGTSPPGGSFRAAVRDGAYLVFLNIASVIGWGTVLLLLNWATS